MYLHRHLWYTDLTMITSERLVNTTIGFLTIIYPYMPIFSNLRASHVPPQAPVVHRPDHDPQGHGTPAMTGPVVNPGHMPSFSFVGLTVRLCINNQHTHKHTDTHTHIDA